MFWKRKQKRTVETTKPGRSVQENMIYMASIGMAPAQITTYENLCLDIKALTQKRSEPAHDATKLTKMGQ